MTRRGSEKRLTSNLSDFRLLNDRSVCIEQVGLFPEVEVE